MIKCRGIPKRRKNRAFHRACKNFRNPTSVLWKFCNTTNAMQKFRNTTNALWIFRNPKSSLRKFSQPHKCLAKISQGLQQFTNPFCLVKSMRNLPCEFQQPLYEKPTVSGKPTVSMKAKSLLKILFKDLQSLCLFRTIHPLLWKGQCYLAKQFSFHSTPRDHQFEEETYASHPIWAMACIRGGHTDLSVSREAGQASLLLKIHLRPLRHRPFHLLRVRYPLALLSTDTRHGDHQLLRPLSH